MASGRKTLKEEREIKEELQKFLPDVYLFYKEAFSRGNLQIKKGVASDILDKLVSDKRADQEELLERLERIEQAIATK